MRNPRATWLAAATAAIAAATPACTSSSILPSSFLAGLRVVAIVAEPPEIGAGESSTVTATVVDTSGGMPAITWSRCLRPPPPGLIVNPDCIANQDAPYLESIGQGASVTVTMPDLTPASLGEPDSTGGVYLPLVVRVVGTTTVIATYRLRLAEPGRPRNTNPKIQAVATIRDAGVQPIEPAVPLTVQPGDTLMLEALLAPGSAESYPVTRAGAVEMVTETLTTSWFSTAGEIDKDTTSAAQPVTDLLLSRRLPAPAVRIYLYAVTRDERGGTDLAQRMLDLR